jgi:hypothetical protein
VLVGVVANGKKGNDGPSFPPPPHPARLRQRAAAAALTAAWEGNFIALLLVVGGANC